MTVAVRPEILSSLQSVREDVERQVAGLPRYRALKAIERTIADFPDLEEVTRSLAGLRDQVQRQLDDTREYRALRTIERIVPELSEVLALLNEQDPLPGPMPGPMPGPVPASGQAVVQSDPATEVVSVASECGIADATVEQRQPDEAVAAFAPVIGTGVDAAERAEPLPARDMSSGGRDESVTEAAAPPQRPAADEKASDIQPAPSLAFSLAQMMVQALTPPQPEPLPADPAGTAAFEAPDETAPPERSDAPAAGKAA